MCELLQMFLQNEKSLFLKSMQKEGTAITFEELLSNIRMVKGCQSLTISKRIQELLLENDILKKTQKGNFYVNENYSFEKVPSTQPDLKGWSVARKIEDIPRDLREKQTPYVRKEAPVSVDAVTTTLHFTSYDIRSGEKAESHLFPVCGKLSITEITDPFAEDQLSKLNLKCDGLTIYVNGKRYWLRACSAVLDDKRELLMWDKLDMQYVTIATVPQFTDPYDALAKIESLLHELSKKQ